MFNYMHGINNIFHQNMYGKKMLTSILTMKGITNYLCILLKYFQWK